MRERFLGLSLADAVRLASTYGLRVQLVLRDGCAFPHADAAPKFNRILVTVVNGIVTDASKG